jgi:hypothetical protein
MSIDKRWILLIALGAGAVGGAAVALTSRSRKRVAGHLQHKEDIKSWENEGGNLKPVPMSAART